MAPLVFVGCFSVYLGGIVRPPAVFVWLCKLHTIVDHALCHATVVSTTKLLKNEESFVCTYYKLFSIGESVKCIYRLFLLTVVCLNLDARHSTSRRTAAGRPISFCTYIVTSVAWYST